MNLSGKAIELINTHALTAELMARGWNVYLPVYDNGVDLLAYQEETSQPIRIQLKTRWCIDRKYLGRNIEIAFREKDVWYLVPHDAAVGMGQEEGYCQTNSWTGAKGLYHVTPMSRSLLTRMTPFTLNKRLGISQITI